ncbi:MAG: hypothetical protein JWO36_4029 [Myxococcales bacterium]|nr:hypothetical protein [Myxococcales bacterium]
MIGRMVHTMAAAKLKVSLTLSADLVKTLDRTAARTHSTRSGLAETWLRVAASHAAARSIEDATAAYYAELTGDAKQEEEAIARATTNAARRITYDAPPRSRASKPRR